MSPADSRKRSPRWWRAYDDAGAMAMRIADEPVSLHIDAARAIELLDLLRTLLRERIEAEASGKAVTRG